MDQATHHFGVVVVGGGPAGTTAALRARELGATVALVERGNLGGTCTNDGCVPTRVLARAARLRRDAEQFGAYGLIGDPPAVNFARLLDRTQEIVYRVHEKKQLRAHLEDVGVTVFTDAGEAQFVDAHTLALAGGTQLAGEKIILCVGGHARRLPFPGSEYALTHSDIWALEQLPRSVAIVGGAATGCQLASIFAAFGSQVTLLEVSPRILAVEDVAISEALSAVFGRRGITITTGISGVDGIEPESEGLRLHYQRQGQAESLQAEKVVMAAGWPGNVESLNLAAAGVQTARGYITVNDALQTAVPHIFAAGDITGRMMLVQSGMGEGMAAAENAVLGTDQTYTHHIVPHGSFTDPEYASVGLTEAAARAQHDVLVALVPYTDLDRAVIDGHTEGFCKLIVARGTRQVLGAHVLGEQAVEIVQIAAAAMAAGMPVEDLANLELSYPTFTAIVGLAARQILHQFGDTPVLPKWRTLGNPGVAEWERSEA